MLLEIGEPLVGQLVEQQRIGEAGKPLGRAIGTGGSFP